MKKTIVFVILVWKLSISAFAYGEESIQKNGINSTVDDLVNTSVNQNSLNSEWEKWLLSPILVGVIAALITQLSTYYMLNKSHRQKLKLLEIKQEGELYISIIKNQVEHINKQLDQFYGPMLALSGAGSVLWKNFCQVKKRSPSHFFTKDSNEEENRLTDDEVFVDYMRVMREVFYPMDYKREKLIVTNAALIELDGETNNFPEVLIQVISHSAELRAIIKRWNDECRNELNIYKLKQSLKTGDQNKIEYFNPAFDFPDDLETYLMNHWNQLRTKKQNLENTLSKLAPNFKENRNL